LVSPMFYRKYTMHQHQQLPIKRTNKKKKIVNTRKIAILPANHQHGVNLTMDYDSLKKILSTLDRQNVIHLLVKENMVKWNTKAPKDVLIDLFLTIQLHRIHLIR